MKYKAIICDVDGTISPLTLHSKVTKRVKTAIQDAQKLIPFCLATGKPFYLIEHLIEDLQLTSPIIVDNGAAIYDAATKTVLWQSLLPEQITQEILVLGQKYHKRMRISHGKLSTDITELPTTHSDISKILFMGLTNQEGEEIIAEIEATYKDVAVVKAQAYEGEGFTDIYVTNAEATKQHAILKLAEILQISPEEMIGVGDGYNDFPLLMACGLKVAMGNAVDDLKEIADYIAPSVEEDGVADVIEKFVL